MACELPPVAGPCSPELAVACCRGVAVQRKQHALRVAVLDQAVASLIAVKVLPLPVATDERTRRFHEGIARGFRIAMAASQRSPHSGGGGSWRPQGRLPGAASAIGLAIAFGQEDRLGGDQSARSRVVEVEERRLLARIEPA